MLIIDGIVFSLQRAGGISVYYKMLLEFLSKKKQVSALILGKNPLQEIAGVDENDFCIRHRDRILERYRHCRLPEYASVFHSSYYRLPYNRQVPTVVTVYDFVYERYASGPRKWIHSTQKVASIRAAQSIICISESTKQDLFEYVDIRSDQNIFVTHLAAADVFQPLNMAIGEPSFILFVGPRAGYKNFNLLLAAMSHLPHLELHCVGGGAIRPSELKGVSESVVTRVRHLGFVTDNELNILYNRAACLVYPSSYEGFGIPVIEAMKAGCPVVSVDCRAVLEVGRDALLIVYDDDPRSMADTILETLSSTRQGLIQRGFVVAQGYSWDKTHSQTLEVYRNLSSTIK